MFKDVMKELKSRIEYGAGTAVTTKRFYELEITRWKTSPKRKLQLTGEKYYLGDQDILQRKRTMIGEDGKLIEVDNLPNNKIVDNQYAKMVDQKKNYLLGQPLTFSTDSAEYEAALKDVFNRKFQRTFKNLGEDCLNGGIAWLHPYYADDGTLAFKRFQPFEILPFWKDSEHTELDAAIRLYEVEVYEGESEKIIEKVEIYTPNGVERYILNNGHLVEDVDHPSSPYVVVVDGDDQETAYNWEKIPLIPFKANDNETPLVKRCKQLQDGINTMLSDFENIMQEDARNTILVLKNYDGQNLGEFRKNLATFGAVKVTTIDGADGGVDTLTIEVNADNYKVILETFKKALIENCRGYDAKDDRLSGNPNQMNIQSMYSDIDLDANEMETEFQASFEELLWFVNAYLANIGAGSFDGVDVDVIFNRDILINESEAIENCSKSVGILSNETIISNHPWIDDVSDELSKVKTEKKEAIDEFGGAFNPINPDDTGDDDGTGDDE